MTYRPSESLFGPPLRERLPSYLYLSAAFVVVAAVVLGERSPSDTWLFHVVVELDAARLMSIRTLAACLVVGSLAAVLQASMRGVRVYGEGVESREVHSFVVPRVRRYKWPQLERIVLDQPTRIALDLWDGTRAFLPQVKNRRALETMLEQVAAARAIPTQGGQGLDELPEPEDGSEPPQA